MPKVIYVQANGSQQAIDVPVGENVMHGALYNNVDGIVGECGGGLSCATCRCTVDAAWAGQAGATTSDAERELLEGVEGELKPNMRLSCQIQVTEALDGLVVHLPESQF